VPHQLLKTGKISTFSKEQHSLIVARSTYTAGEVKTRGWTRAKV
jgi:hypothetical protein